jgi:hypothetical protein
MQKLIKALENMMVAITFAEAGEYDAAKKLTVQDARDEAVLAASQMKSSEA